MLLSLLFSLIHNYNVIVIVIIYNYREVQLIIVILVGVSHVRSFGGQLIIPHLLGMKLLPIVGKPINQLVLFIIQPDGIEDRGIFYGSFG